MRNVRARYIAAFPIDNTSGQPIAVMAISVYKLLQRSDDLQQACDRLNLSPIKTAIAKQLSF
jgi:hypothetical protein